MVGDEIKTLNICCIFVTLIFRSSKNINFHQIINSDFFCILRLKEKASTFLAIYLKFDYKDAS